MSASERYLEHLIGGVESNVSRRSGSTAAGGAHRARIVRRGGASSRAKRALAAALPTELVLLEEPQAAVYSWLAVRGDRWRKDLTAGDRLLVCDIGGGTTDLTLIDVAEQNGALELRGLAVGDHLLVGGDNMDLALAHHVAELFAAVA